MINLYPNPNEKREHYYVFLDIDGTLIDEEYGKRVRGPFFSFGQNSVLKPESIEALNILLASLEQKYDTSLVITSGRRQNFSACVKHLHEEGLVYDKWITCIPFEPGRRGQKIVDHMMTKSQPKFPRLSKVINYLIGKYADSGYTNYVVLEDNLKKIKYEIPPARRIMTNKHSQSLTIKQVENYLKRNNIPVIEHESQADESSFEKQ